MFSESDERAPSTAASVSAVRLASALTSAAFSLRSRSVACVRRSLQALLQLAAAFGEAVDQRPGRLVEDRVISAARGEHRVELARIDADRLGGLVGALADMLADGGEGFRNDVGARHQLRLGLRNLLVDLLGDRLGAVGEPALGLADLAGDARRGVFGAGNHPFVGRSKCISMARARRRVPPRSDACGR